MNRAKIIDRLLLAVLFLLGIAFCAAAYAAQPDQPAEDALQPREQGLFLRLYGSGADQEVRLWQNEGVLYAFLPGWYQEDRVLVSADDPQQRFTVDGHEMTGAGFVSLAPGRHLVEFPADGTQYPLEVSRGSNQLPSIFLELEPGALEQLHEDKDLRCAGQYTILSESGRPLYKGGMSLGGRGNTSWKYSEKRAYLMKLDEKTDLFSMGKARRWVLQPNATDNSQMRNHIVFTMAEQSGMRFVPEHRFAELYINGEYRGLYQLFEKIEVGEGRVEIHNSQKEMEQALPELDFAALGKSLKGYWDTPGSGVFYELPAEAKDVTGGYLMELDIGARYGNAASGFVSGQGQHVVLHNPEYMTRAQLDYIQGLYQHLEDAAWSADGLDPATGQPFWAFADLTSFAQKFLIEEISANFDADKSSQFLYKPEDAAGTQLFAGPPWDYDFSLAPTPDFCGEELSAELGDPKGTRITEGDSLYAALFRHEAFRDVVYQQYYQNFLPLIRQQAEHGIMDQGELLLPSVQMNALRWQIWPEAETPEEISALYFQQLERIAGFLDQRSQWLCSQWPQPEQ